jgi:hypothetical protein
MTQLMGRFALSSFRVRAKIRLEGVDDQPGEKVLVLEMEEAFQEALAQAETAATGTLCSEGTTSNVEAVTVTGQTNDLCGELPLRADQDEA